MNREQKIRECLQEVQRKWYTPTSKIANDINIHQSLVSKFINDNMQGGRIPSENLMDRLENWLKERNAY